MSYSIFDPPYETSEEAFKAKLKSTRKNISLARNVIDRGEDVGNAITRLKGAKNRLCEAVLVRDCGYFITAFDTKDSLQGRFQGAASRELIRKTELLEVKLTELYYGHVITERCWDGIALPMSEYPDELLSCMDEVDALYQHVAGGMSLPEFRWERKNCVKPGQWVLQLRDNKTFDTVVGSVTYHWLGHPMRVLSADGCWAVLKNPESRQLERFIQDSFYLKATGKQDDVSTPFEKRRLWFDLHPEYRQIPLIIRNWWDFGDSRYFTCPCCGYPVLTSHYGYARSIFHRTPITEICLLCDWQDSYQADDGYFFDEPDDGNFGYSLSQARENFAQYHSIYRPSDSIYHDHHNNKLVLNFKNEITSLFDKMPDNQNQGELYLYWCRIERARIYLALLYEELEKTTPSAFTTRYDEKGTIIGRDYRAKRDVFPSLPLLGRWVDNMIDGPCLIVDANQQSQGGSMTIRTKNRELRDVVTSFGFTPIDRYSNPYTPFHIRRTWFESHPEYLRGNIPCPCCALPTIKVVGGNEICRFCEWLDDGRDDVIDDEVRESVNATLSLCQSREKISAEINDDARKQKIVQVYERLITIQSESEADTTWRAIEQLWSKR